MTIEADTGVKDLDAKTIPVAEIFGPTIQGEGALAGKPTYFVRVGGCDFRCLWCDTDHAVLPEHVRKLERYTVEQATFELQKWAAEHKGPDWVTISGGNPGLFELGHLVNTWRDAKSYSGRGNKVAVETQGSIYKSWMSRVDLLTVSPKPPSSGMTQKYGMAKSLLGLPRLDAFITRYGDEWEHRVTHEGISPLPEETFNLVLKVVVFDDADYEFARALHIRYPLIKFFLSCGTAMGGLSGKWVPPLVPDLQDNEVDRFRQVREHPSANWVETMYVDTNASLLRRYRWLVEKMAADDAMSDVAAFPQLHALTWGITTRGV